MSSWIAKNCKTYLPNNQTKASLNRFNYSHGSLTGTLTDLKKAVFQLGRTPILLLRKLHYRLKLLYFVVKFESKCKKLCVLHNLCHTHQTTSSFVSYFFKLVIEVWCNIHWIVPYCMHCFVSNLLTAQTSVKCVKIGNFLQKPFG